MGSALWAFKIGGTVPPQAPPRAPGRLGGAVEETDKIETSTLVQSAERGVGRRYVVDEHAFNPVVAKVTRGSTVTFTNNGQLVHTIVAEDGSWSTGSLVSAESDYVKLDMAGTLTYHCKEHPWAIGRIVVE
jgi:plastocyanin